MTRSPDDPITRCFLFHPHNRDFREALLEGRRLQLAPHLAHDIFGDRAATTLVAFHAHFQGDIEEQALHIVAVIFGQLDPAMAVVGREIRRIHVVHGTAGNQPRLQHGPEVGKHQILKALLLRVIEKKFAQQIAGKRMNVVPLEPRTLARSRQPDRQHYRPLAGAGGSRRRRGNHWSGGGSCYRGWFRCDCWYGRSRYRPRTRSATPPAAATTAGRSWSRFNGRGCCDWCRGGLRRGRRLRLWSRRVARLNNWSFGRRLGPCSGLIVIVFRLQGLGCVARSLGGAVSGLLATL